VRVLSLRKFSYTPNGHVTLLPSDFTTSGGGGPASLPITCGKMAEAGLVESQCLCPAVHCNVSAAVSGN